MSSKYKCGEICRACLFAGLMKSFNLNSTGSATAITATIVFAVSAQHQRFIISTLVINVRTHTYACAASSQRSHVIYLLVFFAYSLAYFF